jgi:AraC-like DNA-binding protein
MRYCEYRPSARLARAVACVWTLDGHARDLDGVPQPVLPDGRAEFVIHLGDRFARLDDGAIERQPWAIFAGQLDRALSLQPTGTVAVLGVRFRPEGAARFTRVPQHELVGQTVDVALASPTLAAVARRVRDAAASLPDAARLVERLLDDDGRHDRSDQRVASVVEAIMRRGGRVSLERAVADTGLSRRQLERLFLRDVGLPPKQLARIARFQRALRILERGAPPTRGTDAALAGGYADQAHFIRDFREFAGCAPSEHLLASAELTGFFSGAVCSAFGVRRSGF